MMISRTMFFLCCMFAVLLSFSPGARSQDPLGYFCPNTTTYNPNSTYRANLDVLLYSLSNASKTNEFYSSTAGLNTSEATYGLFMCRGDIIGDACENCAINASRQILDVCPDRRVATIWYDNCMLRYSNRSIFSVVDQGSGLIMVNRQNVTDGDRFNEVLGSLMDDIAIQAANGGSSKKFAVQARNFSQFQRLYAMAQCTPDLSMNDCDTCLRDGISRIPSCCDRKQGGRVLFPSCNFRFETYRFYNSSFTNATPPSSPPNAVSPPPSTTPTNTNSKGNGISAAVVVAIVVPIGVSMVLFVLGFLFLKRRSKKKYDAIADASRTDGNDISEVESLQYSLSQVQEATNNFSAENKIGEGGFGDVYKGILPDGQEIAVKRLSRTSVQGVEEFKNEIAVVAQLQHRNLVQLLGFCLEGEEKILIYEFVPNKSLDYFLFDSEKQPMLDWSRRLKIIEGIARGLLYLHEDSRLRIIHRDLKASNVLLDANMNSKIADFGMARIFGGDQSQEKTSRIAGTYGYMSPEYAMHGQFSVKSDVYSFGVLVLEIISGKKNSSFYQSDGAEDLLSYAWKNWTDGTPLALLDPSLGDSYATNEVIQCIHVGLLCVQEEAEQRPSMATVVLMLNNYSVTLPVPQQPAFFAHSKTESWARAEVELESDKSTSKSVPASTNETSITEVYPR